MVPVFLMVLEFGIAVGLLLGAAIAVAAMDANGETSQGRAEMKRKGRDIMLVVGWASWCVFLALLFILLTGGCSTEACR